MDSREPLVLPQRTLLVLCGIAGSGKSTFARSFVEAHSAQGLRETSIVSSDYCRALVCDDDNNQQASRDAFDLLYYIVHKRMFQQRFTIVDSTALQTDTRHRLLELAQRHRYHTCLLVFDTSPMTCIQRDRTRTRIVGEEVILYHEGMLRQTLRDIPNEGWHQVYILEEHNATPIIVIDGK
ncbi:MAG: hypothetical protein NVS4B11_11030 [Ktedonobacteraceae bacterium]